VHIGQFIRGQLRFSSVEDLREKISEDVAAVRAVAVVVDDSAS